MQSNSYLTDQQRERSDRPLRRPDSAPPPCGRRWYSDRFHSGRPKCRWGSCWRYCLQLLMPPSEQEEKHTHNTFNLYYNSIRLRTNYAEHEKACFIILDFLGPNFVEMSSTDIRYSTMAFEKTFRNPQTMLDKYINWNRTTCFNTAMTKPCSH